VQRRAPQHLQPGLQALWCMERTGLQTAPFYFVEKFKICILMSEFFNEIKIKKQLK